MGGLCYIILVKGMTEMRFLRVRNKEIRAHAPLSTLPTKKSFENPLTNKIEYGIINT